MLPPKIKLTDQAIHNIKAARIEKRIPAATLSRAIKRDDSYISSLELKRLRSISSVDLVAIVCVLYSIPEEEAIAKATALIGTGTKTDSYPNQNIQPPLSDYGGEDTTRVSEPTAANYRYNAIADYAEPELISDMLDDLTGLINEFYKKEPKEAVFVLNSFVKAMQLDPAFTMSVMALPFILLKSINAEKRTEVLSELVSISNRYVSMGNEYNEM